MWSYTECFNLNNVVKQIISNTLSIYRYVMNVRKEIKLILFIIDNLVENILYHNFY